MSAVKFHFVHASLEYCVIAFGTLKLFSGEACNWGILATWHLTFKTVVKALRRGIGTSLKNLTSQIFEGYGSP